MNLKLYLAAAIVLCVVAVMVLIGSHEAQVSARTNHDIQMRIVPTLRHLEQMRVGILRVVSSTSELIVAKLTESAEEEKPHGLGKAAETETELIQQGDENVQVALNEIRALYRDGQPPAYLKLDEIGATYDRLVAQADRITGLVKADASPAELAAAKEVFERLEMQALDIVVQALNQAQQDADRNFALMSQQHAILHHDIFALGLVTALTLLLYTAYVMRILQREAEARAVAERLAADKAAEVERRKRIENRLAAHQKMEALGTMLGGIAHSVNNFLVPIITLSKMMKQDAAEGSEQHEDLGRIQNAGEKASKLLRQVLAFSHTSEVRNSDSCDLVATVRRALELAKASLPVWIALRESIHLQTARVPKEEADIDTILFNLIGNAVDAIGDAPGHIEVGLDLMTVDDGMADGTPVRLSSGEYARLSIADDGCGIAEGVLPHIFEPFYTTKAVGKGTGLGLSIAYSSLAQVGGDIVASSRPGAGTRFDLFLPLLDKDTATADSANQRS
jgi:signal transduction histidine kinase